MSQDIVERLRVFEADPVLGSPISEAADTIESLRARVAELESDKELVAMWQAQADDRAIIQAAIVSTEQAEERINLSVRACLTISTENLRVAADARLGGLFKFKRSFDEQLAEKDQRIAELEAMFNAERRACHALESQWAEMMLQLAAQALTIKTMRAVLENFIDSHEECTDLDGFTAQIVSMDDYHEAQEALAIPDNSTEILQEWLDKQLGEPVCQYADDAMMADAVKLYIEHGIMS